MAVILILRENAPVCMTGTSACAIAKPPELFASSSVVMVMTDVFSNNKLNLLRKFAKIV